MKRIIKLFLIHMVIVLLLLCINAATKMDQLINTKPIFEPAVTFIVGVGLIGLAAMVKKRFEKSS